MADQPSMEEARQTLERIIDSIGDNRIPAGNAEPFIDALVSATEEAAFKAGWQPIETAPKDRSWLLGWHEDWGCFVFRDGPGLLTGEDPMPTHWMPLPSPPRQSKAGSVK